MTSTDQGRVRRRARFHTLAVKAVHPLTADSVEVTFDVPSKLWSEFDYLPGQFVALRTTLDGRELRRSYSLCRSPQAGSISVAIKKDHGGVFSTWANTELQVGDQIEVMSPEGTFTTDMSALAGKHFAAVAAGSGITPIISLARSVLSGDPDTDFTLVYTNKTVLDVMFLDELGDLKDRYPDRLSLHYVLSRERRSSDLLSGRIDELKLKALLDNLVLPGTIDEWFLCGPFELVQLCRDALEERSIASTQIHFELFTTGDPADAQGDRGAPVILKPGDSTFSIEFVLDGQTTTIETPRHSSESILNAALRVRPDVPFACAGGVCGTCRAKLRSGDVEMAQNYALEPEELENGYVLTCQSRPTSERVVIDYDA